MNAMVKQEPDESGEITTSPSGKPLAPFERAIVNAEDTFEQVANGLDFNVERIFAMQALMKTDFAMKIANQNPRSVRLAMLNLASTGLTLNPANKYAYLVPRDGSIVLEISYKGLLKIATDAGSILWGKAETVHEADSFKYRGPALAPVHEAEVFKDRGPMVGVYCIAKTRDGDILTDFMGLDEIHKIRARSDLYALKKKGPWVEWEGQMTKKAMVKRASNTWPMTDRSERIFKAIEIANASEGGYTFDHEEPQHIPPGDPVGDERQRRHDDALEQYGPSVEKIKDWIGKWDVSQDPDCLYSVAEIWRELPMAAQNDLWLAPTKGGCFTTHERDVIKTKLPREVAES